MQVPGFFVSFPAEASACTFVAYKYKNEKQWEQMQNGWRGTAKETARARARDTP